MLSIWSAFIGLQLVAKQISNYQKAHLTKFRPPNRHAKLSPATSNSNEADGLQQRNPNIEHRIRTRNCRSDRLCIRALSAQCGRHLCVIHARHARALLSKFARPAIAFECLSVHRSSAMVISIAIAQSRMRVTNKWSQQLRASKRNTKSALRQSISQVP